MDSHLCSNLHNESISQNLPIDVILLIVSYFNHTDLLMFSSCSKVSYTIANSDNYWESLLIKNYHISKESFVRKMTVTSKELFTISYKSLRNLFRLHTIDNASKNVSIIPDTFYQQLLPNGT